MVQADPVLHMFCGKIASGKSTLANILSEQNNAILLSEDAWLSALYPEKLTTLAYYVKYSAMLRSVMEQHVINLLNSKISVVLDFPANTVSTRVWMGRIVRMTRARHEMHVLNASDQICLERLKKRGAAGEHPFSVTEQQFHLVTKHYEAPSENEGFNLILHETT